MTRHLLRPMMALAFGLVAGLVAGCGGGGGGGEPADAGRDADLCTEDAECDDGLFCNGREVCMPDSPHADGDGCAPSRAACMASQRCDEDADRCVPDCDAATDADGDGHRARGCGGDDCDDADPRSYPGNAEVCDPLNRDEDCDPTTLGERDDDGDGALSSECCNRAEDGTLSCGPDCDDSTLAQRPGQVEVCDGRDNDCDGAVDEEMNEVPWYPDEDGDGFGASTDPIVSCSPIPGRSLSDADCNDDAAAASPLGTEACDGLDNDCDSDIDEGMSRIPWYPDADRDGFGAAGSTPVLACAPVPGHSVRMNDCDDGALLVNPLASERCNGVDDDCDGTVDEGACADGGVADGGAGADAGVGMP